MKIRVISDLHLEFNEDYFSLSPIPDVDCLIVAGDLHTDPHKAIEWLVKNKEKNTIFVAGNHEFYSKNKNTMEEIYETLKTECYKNGIIFLQNEVAIINNVKFMGCTLWTDYMLDYDPLLSKAIANNFMNDFIHILSNKSKHYSKTITPEIIVEEFDKSKTFLESELNKDFSGKKVVITHHLPSRKSIAKKYLNSQLNPAFGSNLDYLFENVDIWIHGHTHTNTNYISNNTRVICNPRGYGTENPEFNEKGIINV